MQEIREIVGRVFKMSLTVFGLFAIAYLVTDYQTIFAGLTVGMLFGMYNLWTLVRRSKKFDEAIEQGRRGASIGTVLRFVSAIAAVALATAFPEQLDVFGTLIGFGIPYALLVFERILYRTK